MHGMQRAEQKSLELEFKEMPRRGGNSRFREPGFIIIDSNERYRSFFQTNPSETVDWEQMQVVVVFLGSRCSGGYGVVVDSVTYLPQKDDTSEGGVTFRPQLHLRCHEKKPSPGACVTAAFTYPYTAVQIPVPSTVCDDIVIEGLNGEYPRLEF
jgi:hypothetical protein